MVTSSPVGTGFRAALPTVVREFLHAFIKRSTYRLRENPYLLFGFLWGLPVPIVCIGIDLWVRGLGLGSAFSCVVEHPIHLVFLAHPFLFALVFGAMGTIRRRKDQQIHELLDALETKVIELERAYERLKDLDRLKSEFIANVSHELRTPMVCISGYTEQILSGRMGPLTSKQEDGLKVMERNEERLMSLIDELLEASRFESGRVRLIKVDFDLRDLAWQTEKTAEVLAGQRGVRVVIEAPDSPVYVSADRERISRVLLNLLSNALKFTDRGGEAGLRLEADAGQAKVTVWDTGVGIAQEHLPRIFDRFWQADGSSKRRYGGTGLGLSIVKSILDAHGCEIVVTSEAGKGTTFVFRLPLALAHEAAPVASGGAHGQ